MRYPLVLVAASLTVASAPLQTPDSWAVTFTDIGARAGLVHPSIYGGVDRKRFIIETNGCGTAFVDYDNDGWIDALVLSGTMRDDEDSVARATANRVVSTGINMTAYSRTSPPRQASRKSDGRPVSVPAITTTTGSLTCS